MRIKTIGQSSFDEAMGFCNGQNIDVQSIEITLDGNLYFEGMNTDMNFDDSCCYEPHEVEYHLNSTPVEVVKKFLTEGGVVTKEDELSVQDWIREQE